MKITGRILAVSFVFLALLASYANCEEAFSDKPPSKEQLMPMVKTAIESSIDRFCFAGNNDSNLTQNAKAIFLSFGQSASVDLESIEIKQVGKYKGYWPIEVYAKGSCTLQYRDDFAQNSPMFDDWRGKVLSNEFNTVVGIDVRENDFGKPQVRLRD